jgi:hypothetical protein
LAGSDFSPFFTCGGEGTLFEWDGTMEPLTDYSTNLDPEDVLWDVYERLRLLINSIEGYAGLAYFADDPSVKIDAQQSFHRKTAQTKAILDNVETYLNQRRQEER